MRVFTLLFSLFTFINNKMNIKCEYETIPIIEYIYDDYKVIEREQDIEVLYKDKRLDLLDCKYYYKIIYEENILVIFYKNSSNDYLKIIKYSKGKNILEKTINNKFINAFDVLYYKGSYIFVSSFNEVENEIISSKLNEKNYLLNRNAIIISFDSDFKITNCEIYGGVLDDYFSKIYINDYDETIYITGAKDQNSGYDFGYGGSGTKGYLLVQIDKDLNIINYLVFDEEIKTIEFNEFLTIYTTLNVFLFDYDYSFVSSLKLASGCVFGYMTRDNYCVIFSSINLKIYDFNKNILLVTYEFEDFIGVENVEIKNDFVYLKVRDTLYKAIFYDSSLENKIFIYDKKEIDNTNLNVFGIPHNFELKNISYESGYNRGIFGKYKMILEYDYFKITCEMEILDRCNVVDGYIYPIDYKLKFSGEAYLNGNKIDNGYPILEEGEYELKLIGKAEERIYKFKVYEMDILYQDEDLKHWDYEIYENQVLSVNLNYDSKYTIKNIIVNNEEFEFINDLNKKIITINFKEENSGLYKYTINKIIYEYKGNEYVEEVNYNILLKVLKDKISLENDFYNNEEQFIFKIKLLDNYDVRFLKIQSDSLEEQYLYIPIKEGNINLENYFNESINVISFYLVYDVGGKLYEEQILFKLKYDFNKVNEFAHLLLTKNNDQIEEIVIKFDYNDNLKTVIIDDVVRFSNNTSIDHTYLLVSIIIVIILFGCAKTIKSINKKKDKKIKVLIL